MSVVKLKGTHGMVPCQMFLEKGKYKCFFPFDLKLKDDIKAMTGARWDPANTCWSFKKCRGNDFRLAHLIGLNPYARYDQDLIPLENIERSLFAHQIVGVEHILTRRECIVAAEPGTGKTLMAIEALERAHLTHRPWWVGPLLTLASTKIQLKIWDARVDPLLITYERLRKLVEDLPDSEVPNFIVLDESTRVKSPTAQRTEAAFELTERMREIHGDNCYIVLMSGRPAPNSPMDWWAQAEIACPGFLREGNPRAFKQRLAIEEERNLADGTTFSTVVTWKDDVKKCNVCGVHSDKHKNIAHTWVPSTNEVEKLDRRLRGLVLKIFKKDCLDLPEKIYRVVKVKPAPRALMLSKMIRQQAENPGDMMFKLRSLSDGYLISEKPSGQVRSCKSCNGSGKIQDIAADLDCPDCDGGWQEIMETEVKEVLTAKKDAVVGLLDEFADYGRLIFYAPYHASQDLIAKWCKAHGWEVIQFDGRGARYIGDKNLKTAEEMLEYFQSNADGPIAFVGNQDSAGMGLTLTKSPAVIFYSNSFNSESRDQGMDRIHRIGSESAIIIDIEHLPIDKYVRDNLDTKARLQDMSLGKVSEDLEVLEEEFDAASNTEDD